jgi:hypothetical protein
MEYMVVWKRTWAFCGQDNDRPMKLMICLFFIFPDAGVKLEIMKPYNQKKSSKKSGGERLKPRSLSGVYCDGQRQGIVSRKRKSRGNKAIRFSARIRGIPPGVGGGL